MIANTSFTTLFKSFALLLAILGLQACTVGGKVLKEADSAQTVAGKDIILVGTVELKPALREGEQVMDSPKGVWDLFGVIASQKDRAMLQVNNKPDDGGYKYVINPELGKRFFFTVPRDKFYIVDGTIFMEMRRTGTETMRLPTGFKFDIKPGDKAVYIGKITFIRDDFNSITEVRLSDNYTSAAKEFRKKFGSGYTLSKSLISKI